MAKPTSGQLDIPLVWETDQVARAAPDVRGAQRATAPIGKPGVLRLWLAVVCDLGFVVLAVGGAWVGTALLGAALLPAQLAVVAVAGLLLASVLSTGCLWPWRGTPGMLLVGIAFSQPLSFGRVCRLWLVWLGMLPLLGVPLVVSGGGRTVAERLAGA
ncbi:MAG: hypothetical protein GW878_02345, partial [Acidobacteria bacterium]|nr:hypothetical protein [Acidobacteriota bacterium]